MVRILPYKLGSRSAKDLVRSLGSIAKIKNNTDAPKYRNQVIINWGCSDIEFNLAPHMVFNKPANVRVAANKLSSLQLLKQRDVAVCDFTTDKAIVQRWLNDGFRVLVRHVLNGHSGRGIEILREGSTIPNAPLYTKYHKKTNEFRVHVFDGIVIDYVEKKRAADYLDEGDNSLIRSHGNGWIFCRENIAHIRSVKNEAVKAVRALGLEFGAVDVIYSKDKPIILEVNTAPGLQGTTLDSYVNAIRSIGNGI